MGYILLCYLELEIFSVRVIRLLNSFFYQLNFLILELKLNTNNKFNLIFSIKLNLN